MDKSSIKTLSVEEILSADTFNKLLSEKNEVKRAELKEFLKIRASELKVANSFKNLLKAHISEKLLSGKRQNGNQTDFPDQPLALYCGEWHADSNGVRKMAIDANGNQTARIASPFPIMIVEILKNIYTDINKVKLSFFKDKWETVTVSASTIASNSKIVELADYGVPVNSSTAKLLVEYLGELLALNEGVIPKNDSVSHLGWINGEFVPYNDKYKFDGQNEFKTIFDSVYTKGDYTIWQAHAKELRKNIIMRLAIDTALASVIVERVGGLPFILHLWGETAFGKTVTAMVCASVWGNPIKGGMWRSMNNTINYSMSIAGMLRNLPVIFDELQTIKDNGGNYDKLIMCLTEGINRGRMSYNKLEKTEEWSCAFIFCGEENITKSNSGGGTKNRVIEVECTEKLIEDGNKTANLVLENYGWLGMYFVDLIKGLDKHLKERYRYFFNEITGKCDTTDKQAMAMACIMIADELITGKDALVFFPDEKPLTIDEIKPFLTKKSEVDISNRAWEYLNDLIATNINKFDAVFGGEIWGKIEGDIVMINKTILMRELSDKGFEFDACKRKWSNQGYLLKNSQGRLLHHTKCNGIKASYIKLNMSEINNKSLEKPPF